MTRKHFEALAAALRSIRPQVERRADQGAYNVGCCDQWNSDVSRIATVCEQANDRFDRRKFIQACGGHF